MAQGTHSNGGTTSCNSREPLGSDGYFMSGHNVKTTLAIFHPWPSAQKQEFDLQNNKVKWKLEAKIDKSLACRVAQKKETECFTLII